MPLKESSVRSWAGLILILDTAFTVAYYINHREDMTAIRRRIYRSSLMLIPLIYQIYGMIYFYPEHKFGLMRIKKEFMEGLHEEFVQPIKSKWGIIWTSQSSRSQNNNNANNANNGAHQEGSDSHENQQQQQNNGQQVSNKKARGLCYRIICAPVNLLCTLILLTIVFFARCLIFFAYFFAEWLIIFAYALYINGGLLLRFLNFMNYAVIVEHFGGERSYLQSKGRAANTVVIINGTFILLSSFPTLIIKSAHNADQELSGVDDIIAQLLSFIAIVLQVLQQCLQKTPQVNRAQVGDQREQQNQQEQQQQPQNQGQNELNHQQQQSNHQLNNNDEESNVQQVVNPPQQIQPLSNQQSENMAIIPQERDSPENSRNQIQSIAISVNSRSGSNQDVEEEEDEIQERQPQNQQDEGYVASQKQIASRLDFEQDDQQQQPESHQLNIIQDNNSVVLEGES